LDHLFIAKTTALALASLCDISCHEATERLYPNGQGLLV